MGIQSARVRHSALVALFFVFVVASGAPSVHAERPLVFAIEGARVIPAPGQEIADGTVVIRDGLIVAVGTDAAIPPDAVVIEGEGLWVYAGLIDASIDLALESAGQSASTPGGGRSSRGGAAQPARPGAVHPLPRVHPEDRAVDRLLPFAGEQRTVDLQLGGR